MFFKYILEVYIVLHLKSIWAMVDMSHVNPVKSSLPFTVILEFVVRCTALGMCHCHYTVCF